MHPTATLPRRHLLPSYMHYQIALICTTIYHYHPSPSHHRPDSYIDTTCTSTQPPTLNSLATYPSLPLPEPFAPSTWPPSQNLQNSAFKYPKSSIKNLARNLLNPLPTILMESRLKASPLENTKNPCTCHESGTMRTVTHTP